MNLSTRELWLMASTSAFAVVAWLTVVSGTWLVYPTVTPEHATTAARPTRPRERNGGPLAAFLAAGIGCAVFGATVVGAAASEELARLLTISEPVGPLSGKAIAAVAAWLGSWTALHLLLRRRDISVAVPCAPLPASGTFDVICRIA